MPTSFVCTCVGGGAHCSEKGHVGVLVGLSKQLIYSLNVVFTQERKELV